MEDIKVIKRFHGGGQYYLEEEKNDWISKNISKLNNCKIDSRFVHTHGTIGIEIYQILTKDTEKILNYGLKDKKTEDRVVKYRNVYGDNQGEVIINNLNDLLNFRKTIAKGKEIILSRWMSDKDDTFEIEI
jgi:S-adenosylmethionine:tRNA-ribosyltransferase-isomerase (queuine synthetase)